MKFIPILFQTLMVQATLPGRKTMTRRLKGLETINEAPGEWLFEKFETNAKGGISAVFTQQKDNDLHYSVPCPYGKAGDVLWVKETMVGTRYPNDRKLFLYKADIPTNRQKEFPYQSALFMPKADARIWLEVESITVERLHDISEEDAIAEGIDQEEHVFEMMAYPDGKLERFEPKPKVIMRKDYVKTKESGSPHFSNSTAKECFEGLWKLINGAKSWDANPWVWVISFKKIERPVNFI